MGDIFQIWMYGFLFTAGMEYENTVRGKYAHNFMLAVRIFFFWPIIQYKNFDV